MDQTRKKILSREDIQKLRKQIRKEDKTEMWMLMFDITLKHGLRAGETVKLQWRNIDFENEELIIEDAKGGKNRTIAIDSDYLQHLRQLGMGKEGEKYLFPSPHGGHYGKRSFQKRIRDKWAMDAGLYPSHITPENIKDELKQKRRITPHTLRHTFATQHLRNNTPIEKVSDMLGHTDVSTTYQEYSHLVTEDHREYQNTINL